MQVNNRLFEIIYILMQKKKTTAKELADKLNIQKIEKDEVCTTPRLLK